MLILGTNGQIARVAIDLFLERTDAHLSLYLRNSSRLKELQSERISLLEGDVLDLETLRQAVAKQDIVYANLGGLLVEQARDMVKAMQDAKVSRLIWISSMGIYDKVPGEQFGAMLDPYRKSAALIEASDLDYTILRPSWLHNNDEIDYEITQKNEPFKGAKKVVSRKSVADLVVRLTQPPGLHYRESLGVNKPYGVGTTDLRSLESAHK